MVVFYSRSWPNRYQQKSNFFGEQSVMLILLLKKMQGMTFAARLIEVPVLRARSEIAGYAMQGEWNIGIVEWWVEQKRII